MMTYDGTALKQLKENSSWYLILGIGLVVLGTLAVFYSFFATLISVIYLGILVLCLGIFEGIKSFSINKWSSFLLHLFISILYCIGGIFIIANPELNAITLTLLLAIFFIVAGIARIVFALTQHIPHKGWVLFNGAITLLLGILIWQQWPYSGLWVLGMFTGIDMIFMGFTWIQLSMMAKKLQLPVETFRQERSF